MKSILAGLRVADFTQVAAGPTCTMMLADRGADVIKIEAPTGDLGRQLGPPWQNGQSVIYMALNRNKRSVVLDLKTDEGIRAARQLVAGADIVVESFRPGVMRRLGLDYETVRAINPKLIYCSISAYGQRSPDAGKPGVDGIVQAVTGLMSLCGLPGEEPSKVQTPIIDMTTGILATLAVQDALLHRQATGAGQWLDVSMYESALQLQQTSLASYFSDRVVPRPCGSGAPYSAPNEAYPTRDGWIMIAAYHPQRWHAFCQLLGLQQYEKDVRFSTSGDRVQNRRELADIVATALRSKTTKEWLPLFEAADIICAPVANYADLVSSPTFAAGGYTASFQHKEAGHVEFVRPYAPAVAKPSDISITPAPALGEHTEEVLAGLAVLR
ncbi:CaiB/BaiF CoA transferase family protein [Eoetvoesiella caeni]|uniref:Crotonobetainyl-CoA:carnitine CoA-transferase CaiB-like acyl-CoA transferase n=1 Tax=Eoetvoesiella caeni TaxID=645616 RepID=A0A366H0H3_9BURK|nr:CoA transferase [Eoetvoesiella caeni]MCI2811280.1 CoA transferase [Eoetvoesiella caeni]NYT57169.1 CoA transferase [Eoetvoesiella caeni]RBP34997.1 crotonobetainyl-CoA:carnitine CoA-transferase CaiB-like acyl-CoA transferase [Eoetvoesiella caeni]